MPGKGHSPRYAHAFPLPCFMYSSTHTYTHTHNTRMYTRDVARARLTIPFRPLYIFRVVVVIVGQIFTRRISERGRERERESSPFFVHTLQYPRLDSRPSLFFAMLPRRMGCTHPSDLSFEAFRGFVLLVYTRDRLYARVDRFILF